MLKYNLQTYNIGECSDVYTVPKSTLGTEWVQ